MRERSEQCGFNLQRQEINIIVRRSPSTNCCYQLWNGETVHDKRRICGQFQTTSLETFDSACDLCEAPHTEPVPDTITYLSSE